MLARGGLELHIAEGHVDPEPFLDCLAAQKEPPRPPETMSGPFAFFHMRWHTLLTTGLPVLSELGSLHRLVTRRPVALVISLVGPDPAAPRLAFQKWCSWTAVT